jgi:ribulose-phosphate 3-epimerase
MAAGTACPICREGLLGPTNLPGRYRCDHCLRRFELVSVCQSCGEHATIVRSASAPLPVCGHCGASLREHVGPDLDLDVHLMIDRPERHVQAIAEAGASGITFHAEATNHAHRVLQQIRELGCRAGLAVCPGTPLSAYEELADAVDLALCMTVNPGWGGQKLIPATIDKTRRLAELLPGAIIQVDGGVDHTSARDLAAAGAQWMVAGSAVFGAADPIAAYQAIVAAADSGN